VSRPNYFNNIHKTVRAGLFETALQVARTDFGDLQAAVAAARSVVELMDFLDEHAAHEQGSVFPELASFAPALAAELEAEHIKMEQLQTTVRALAHRVHRSSSNAREETGPQLARVLALLVADQLRHLDREETEANAAAWANRTDAQLAQVQARAQAAMSPETRERLTRRMLPALNIGEQVELLSGARNTLPAAAFAALVALAREVLGPERWAVLGSRLEPRRSTLSLLPSG
jgi:hypothetical protein